MESTEFDRPTSINDLPVDLFRSCILTSNYKSPILPEDDEKHQKKKSSSNSWFTSKELFMLRGVCGRWLDSVRITWCQIVKDEILDQVQSLDLLYEKETTTQLMEFKVKYLTSYATLLNQYFINLNFREVVHDIVSSGDTRGLIIILITWMVVKPGEFIPASPEEISSELLEKSVAYMQSEEYEEIYKKISEIDTIPKLSFQQMKIIKTEYMDRFWRSDSLNGLTNSARIMASWLDAILEFTVLKHEALILSVKKQNILQKIKHISIEWPRKKQFIERAYKILLFTKRVKPEINITLWYLKKSNLYDFMDKSKMDTNKVYLKIKDIENREAQLAQRKREIEACQSCGHNTQIASDPNRFVELVSALNGNNDESMSTSQGVQTESNAEIQTDAFDGNDLQSSNHSLVSTSIQIHQSNSQQDQQEVQVNTEVEEEEKFDESWESEEESKSDGEKPVYRSIRERYARQLNRERRKREQEQRRNQRANENSLSATQTEVIPIENIESENPEDAQLPGENPREMQSIIQLLSSKLLCQILSAGDLFQSQFTEKLEETAEQLRSQYFSVWYEDLLKARIFLADRHERVERSLQKIGLIPKDEEPLENEQQKLDEFYIEEVDMNVLEEKLKDESVLKTIYNYILEDEETYEI